MNRGHLPGFYFDEEKKKYFPITANHIAPEGAKYSKENVNAEARQAKRRKRDRQHERALKKQTVPAARLVKHPLLGGSGLLREHGGRQRFGCYDVAQRKAVAQGFEATEIRVLNKDSPNSSITDFRYLPDTSKILLSVRHNGSHLVHANDWTDPIDGKITIHGLAEYAFHDPILSLDHATMSGVSYVVASAARPNPFTGNIFVGSLAQSYDGDSMPSGHHAINVGKPEDTIWECRVNEWSHEVAVAGTHGCQLHSIGKQMQSLARYTLDDSAECFAADWLNPRTLAMGSRRNAGKDVTHGVLLWDVRSDGAALRIKRRARTSGVRRPDSSDHHLLVSSSSDISMYDLRVMRKDRPLLLLDHKSGSTKLHMSTLQADLVAAVDQYNKMQVWSLRSGEHVRTLHNFQRRPGLLYQPRWQHDRSSGAPFLQACLNDTLQQWSWQTDLDEG